MWQWCFWLMAAMVWGHAAHGQTVFRQVYGDSTCYDEGYSVLPYGNGYLVSATQQCGANRLARIILLDANGDSTGLIAPIDYNGYMHAVSDGGYVFLGGNVAGLAYDTIVITKTDQLLDTAWSRSLFFPECNNQVYDLVEVADGYVVTGIFSETACSTGTSIQSFATKLDANGVVVWQQTYGTLGEDDQLFVVKEKPNGELWFYGWKRDGTGEYPWLLITDEQGDSLTSYTQTTFGNGFGYGFELTADGGFITISYSDSVYARKFDADLNLEWQRTLGLQSGGVYFRAFEMQDFNYGFLACIDGPTGCNSHLYKLNRDGDILWAKNWNGLLRTVIEPEPGQYLLTGYSNAFPVLPEALVVRFDTIFDSIPDFVLERNQELNLQLYPNPAAGKVQLQSSQPFDQVSLTSIDGRLLHHYTFPPTLLYSVALPPLANGIYLLRVQTNTGRSVFKKLLIDN